MWVAGKGGHRPAVGRSVGPRVVPGGAARRSLTLLSAAALSIGLAGAVPTAAQAVDTVGVTVTIHHVWQVNCDDNERDVVGIPFNACPNDYYAKAFFPSGEDTSPRAPDNQTEVAPNWQLSGTFDRDAGPFGVRIQLWDHDSTSGDDLIDIANGDANLDIVIDPNTGDFSGDVPTPSIGYSTGSGADSAAVWFSVTFGNTVDFDGDGLHDGIERSAIVVDKDGRIPEHGNLRSLAADDSREAGFPRSPRRSNPCRPTVLTEIDYMNGPDGNGDGLPDHTHKPTQGAIDEAIAAFDAGDVPARANCPYGGFVTGSGVQLLMVIDDALAEVDKLNWGSGPTVGGAMVTGQTLRNANFDQGLRPYYHYSLWNHRQPDNPPTAPGGPPALNNSSGRCCSDSGKDVLVSLGGWTGGVGTQRDQAGTFMHELGHALGLQHGGGQPDNCKPNYHSVMSYVYQTVGVPDASLPPATQDYSGDGVVDNRDQTKLDFSPVKLRDLDEDALDEGAGVGGTTADIFLWDGDGAGPWRVSVRNAAVNWDRSGDGDDDAANIDAGTVDADVNFMGIPSPEGCPNLAPAGSPPGPGTPPPGTVGVVELFGFDDWENLKYKGPLAPPSSGSESEQELTKEMADYIRAAYQEAVSRTDLDVHLTDSPDPVAAGRQLTYSLQAHNHGSPNTAYRAQARLTLPSDVTFASAPAGCTYSAGVVTCALGDLAAGASRSASVTVNVPADLVYRNGGPKDISAQATVSHDGTDSDTTNNTATVTTKVVAVADVQITTATATGPREVLIGTPSSLSLDVTIANAGPSSPIDTVLTTSASASGGVSITPATSTTQQPALAVGSPRTVSATATVSCSSPGVKTVTLTANLALKNSADSDPDLTNNRSSASFQIDCVVPIAINIRPGGFPNSVNLNTDATVAALSTLAGEYGLPLNFDATKINVSTVLWGLRGNLFNVASPSGAREIHNEGHLERSYEPNDRTRDADLDMVLHFKPADSGLTLSSTEACLKGRYTAPDGNVYTFFGCDSVRVVN